MICVFFQAGCTLKSSFNQQMNCPDMHLASLVPVLLTMGNLLSLVGAGNGDSLCLNLGLSFLSPAPLPSNAEILMDSYNYLSLLPQRWQRVDLDTNNGPLATTSVSIFPSF
jgi:hypothetical protein